MRILPEAAMDGSFSAPVEFAAASHIAAVD